MAGLVIDPAAINAKLDYILAQLSTINKRLNSHDERIARLEKFQQEKKVGLAATPTAAMIAVSHPLVHVKAHGGRHRHRRCQPGLCEQQPGSQIKQ